MRLMITRAISERRLWSLEVREAPQRVTRWSKKLWRARECAGMKAKRTASRRRVRRRGAAMVECAHAVVDHAHSGPGLGRRLRMRGAGPLHRAADDALRQGHRLPGRRLAVRLHALRPAGALSVR